MTTKRSNGDGGGMSEDKPEGRKSMSRRAHHALAPLPDDRAEPLTPQAVTKQEFGRRLQALLDERGWRQSDLMRKTIEADPEERGLKRDAISTYINGRSFPTPMSLNLLARAFGITKEELFPNAAINAMNDENPALEMRQAQGHPGQAWVRINRMMPFDVAAQIVVLINESDKKSFEDR